MKYLCFNVLTFHPCFKILVWKYFSLRYYKSYLIQVRATFSLFSNGVEDSSAFDLCFSIVSVLFLFVDCNTILYTVSKEHLEYDPSPQAEAEENKAKLSFSFSRPYSSLACMAGLTKTGSSFSGSLGDSSIMSLTRPISPTLCSRSVVSYFNSKMKTCCNLNPAYHKCHNLNLSSSLPPELRSVNRHDEKEPLDKDLEDPCQKLDPFMGCLNSQKLRRRFETHLEKTDIQNNTFDRLYALFRTTLFLRL